MSRLSCTAVICNKRGLHARAAAKLAALANRQPCSVYIGHQQNHMKNAKNIMDVMMLAASCGCEITLAAEGEQAQQALDCMVELINNRFDEDA